MIKKIKSVWYTPKAFLSIIFMATFSPVKRCVASLTLAKPPFKDKFRSLFPQFFYSKDINLSQLFRAAHRYFEEQHIAKQTFFKYDNIFFRGFAT